MIRIISPTCGILLCIKMMSQSEDPVIFGVCGLSIPMFFVYGWMAIQKMHKDKEKNE